MEEVKIEKKVYKVFELTRLIRGLLSDSFPAVWVEGEISNFTLHSSGHMYFSMRDEKAVIQCAMFKRANQKLKFKPKDGMKVICFGAINVFEPRGNYQLIAEEIEPKGIGALQLQFQQLRENLKKEGLFDEAHKVPIPFLPKTIGIVTSPTGAAIHDILNVSRRRFSNVEIIINPVKVQGEGAREEIALAIREFNELGNIDVMIVGRGGGSMEDLWPFNEEIVARAIYESKIPVISAVGHEVDYTIADFVSDFRAPTPSAAAELVIPRKEDLELKIDKALRILRNSLSGIAMQYEQRVDELFSSLIYKGDAALKIKEKILHTVMGKLEALSPLAVLSRGYSITMTQGGKVIKDAGKVKVKDILRTRVSKGEIVSRVEDINRDE